MDENSSNDIYFNWLVSKIKGSYYEQLLYKLYTVPFKVNEDSLDFNRALDGLKLREKFKIETHGRYDISIKNKRCTFLEMLIALAMRLDNDIMYEPKYGDRYLDWFWAFIDNMDMSDATNDHWNLTWDRFVERRTSKILKKTYLRNGSGGMFMMFSRPDDDLRKMDIWKQMVLWVDENMRKGE